MIGGRLATETELFR